jgi:di/tricarboxylate transporter
MNFYDVSIVLKIFILCLIFWLIIKFAIVFALLVILTCLIVTAMHWDRLHILTDKFLKVFDNEKY